MVAKDSSEFTKQIPNNVEEWYDFKSSFLTFANYRNFGKVLLTNLPPIPATDADPYSAAGSRHAEAVRRRESQYASAWYFLTNITGTRYKHLITRFGERSPPNTKAAWEAIVSHFENAAGTSQAQVLRTRLAKLKYVDGTFYIDSGCRVVVERPDL